MIKQLLIIFLVCLSLVTIWFKDGYILGTAEAVLPFYNLERYYHLTEYAWTFHPGLGNFASLTIASKTTYLFLSALQNFGVPGFILQAAAFLFILLSAGTGIYFLTREFFPKLPGYYYLFSALFYLFNPISMVNVWNRFLLNFMFFYALFPIGILIFNKGLRKRNYYYAILLSVVLAIYNFAFSALVFIILLWLTFGLLTLCYFLLAETLKEKLLILKFFSLSLIFFLLSNIWYLTQLLNYTASDSFQRTFRDFHSQQINIDTLNALSAKMGNLSDLYRLSNFWFFNDLNLTWTKLYVSSPVLLIGFLTTAIVIYGIIKGRKQFSVILLSALFFIALFLSKGSNPPLEFIYRLSFEYLPFFQVFRNPIEKFSFLLILVYAPLLSIGLYYISNNFSKKIAIASSIIILLVWSYPFLTSQVLTGSAPPNSNTETGFKVDVPKYYEETNQALRGYGNNFRAIGFPVADEGISYNWNKGYQGADIPSTLFDMPVIMFNTAVPYYYDLVKEIEPSLKSENFVKIANLLNVRFFILREDVDYKSRNLSNPQDIENLLMGKKNSDVKKIGEFGKLKVWENLKWQDKTFFAVNTLVTTPEAKLINLKNLGENEALVEGEREWKNNSKLPKITYLKINPTLYKVKVENSVEPFVLVFSETFNPSWQAKIGNSLIKDHFRINVYANAWKIEKTGDFEIEIKYLPQEWLEKGQLISAISLLIGLVYLIIYRKKS